MVFPIPYNREKKRKTPKIMYSHLYVKSEPFLCNIARARRKTFLLLHPHLCFFSPVSLALSSKIYIRSAFGEEKTFCIVAIYIIIKYGYNMKHGKSAIKIDSSFLLRIARSVFFPPSPYSISTSPHLASTRSRCSKPTWQLFFFCCFLLLSSFQASLRLFSQGNGNFLNMHVLWSIHRT